MSERKRRIEIKTIQAMEEEVREMISSHTEQTNEAPKKVTKRGKKKTEEVE